MGAYCPVSVVERSPELIDDVVERIALPTLHAMRLRDTPFTGLLYAGLMLTADGPKVWSSTAGSAIRRRRWCSPRSATRRTWAD